MKVNIQKYTKRFVPLLTALLVFVACVSFPVGATSSTVSYLDLDPNIIVDGDNNLIRLYVPSEYWSIHLRNSANDILASVTDGDVLSYWLEEGKSYRIDVYFFRNTHFSVRGLPDDTRITISWNSEQGAALLPSPSFMQETWYFDSSGNEVSWSGATPVSSSYQGEVSYDWYIMPESVPNASSMAFGGNFSHGTAVTSGTFNYWIEYVLLEFSISSFLVSQQMTGQNTEILNQVKKQLAEQGKTVNDILNGTPEQNEQADQFKDNADSVIGDLDEAGDKLSSVEKPDVDVGTFVPDQWLTGTDYLTYTATINNFWSSDILSNITIILGGMLVISYLLFGEKG